MPSKSLRLLTHNRGDFAEAAITLPVTLLTLLVMFNLALAGFVASNAANAASYAARRASVNQADPAAVAIQAANEVIAAAPVGTYVVTVTSTGVVGEPVTVEVAWSLPNWFAGLGRLFGLTSSSQITGTAYAAFAQEGW